MKTKKFLSFALVLAMLVGMLPGMSLTASAEVNTSEITPTNTSGTMTITLTIAYNVSITAGENMTKTTSSGAESQDNVSSAITDVVYTADDGYYFPTDYSVAAVNGISITRNDYTQITVSGTPTAAVSITLTAPTAKTTPDAPTTAAAVDCTTADNNDGKLTGVTTAMEYKKSDAENWTAGTGSDITGLVPGTYYVRVKATDTTLASDNQTLTIKSVQTITSADVTATYGDTGVSVSASVTDPATGGGAISYAVKTGSEDYIDVDADGKLTIKAVPQTDGKAYVIVKAAETNDYAEASKEVAVTINKAEATVTAKNQSIVVGDTVPDLSSPVLNTHYTVTGLLGTDTLTTAPTLTYQKDGSTVTPNNTSAGTYDIVASGASAGNNYNISYTKGTLTISSYVALTDAAPTIELTKASGNIETGKPQVGDTLTAKTTPENAVPVTYQWYRGGEPITDATGKTYVLTAEDVDKTITVKVSQAAGADGGSSAAVNPATSAATAAVELKDNTTTPIAEDALKTGITKTDTTISITAPQSGYEYAVVAKGTEVEDGTEWQSGNGPLTFNGLTHGTEYDMLVRAEATTGSKPGVPTRTTVATNVTVSISAPVAEGVTSTVTIDPTPVGAVKYKWFRDDDLTTPISTEKDYVPTADDINKKLTLKIYDANGDEIGVAVFGDEASETVKSFSDYFNEQLNTDPAPDTITLDGPVTGPITIPAGKEITLDLNGKTVTGGVAVNGKAVIKDTTGTGVINGGVTVENGGEVTIESGTVNDGVTVKTGGKATITGGTINGELNVEDGGTLTVTGGTFTDPDVVKYIDKNDENADVTVKLSKDETPSDSPVTLDIKGKVTFDLNDHTLTGSVNVGENATLNISDSATGGKLTGDLVNDGSLGVNSGTIEGNITNNTAAILGDINGEKSPAVTGNVTNNGAMTVLNGTYSGTITNTENCTLNGGTFNGAISNGEDAIMGIMFIEDGVLNGNVSNSGIMTLAGGTVNGTGTVTNEEKGTLTVDGGEINVNIVNKGTATIEDGTFASGKSVTTTTEKGKTTISGGTFKGSVTSTGSGKTTIKGGQFDSKPTASTPGTVSIEGGKFKANPTEANDGVTTVSGKQIFKVEGKDYPYQVADKPNTNAAAVEVSQGETTAEVANTITDADKTDAENTAKSTTADLEEAAVEHVKQIVAASTTVTNNDKNIVIVPALAVKAEAYTVSDSNATMTLDIEATYKSYETVSSITTASQVQTNISDTGKVKEIGSGKLDTTGKAVDVKIVVPDAFAQAMGATTSNTSSSAVTVYVKHTHESKNYEYRAKLYYADSKYFVEFTNPNGFSPFTLSKESESVVTVTVNGENRYYTDMGSALNDIPDGATLTLTKNDMTEGDLTAVITSAKEITIAKGETNNDLSKLNITAGSGLDISKTDNGDGTVTFKTTQRSSGGDGGNHGGSGGSHSSGTTYAPTVSNPSNGTVSISPTSPKSGDKVTITAKPNADYEVDTVTVTNASGKTVTVTKNADGTYSFTQPSGKVKIDVTFKAAQAAPASTAEVFAPYSDLNASGWYADGVRYALENGIMSGYGNGKFGPGDTTSRAMIAQILYNLEGKPAYSGMLNYTDVDANDWYAAAIRWANAESIIDGYGNHLFGPNDVLTREQLVTILYRYAKSKGVDVSGQTSLTGYNDAASVSGWAEDAMQWAVAAGIITGKGHGTLDPKGNATRSEIATIMMRYCENIAK